jgi:hypothetical protein
MQIICEEEHFVQKVAESQRLETQRGQKQDQTTFTGKLIKE